MSTRFKVPRAKNLLFYNVTQMPLPIPSSMKRNPRFSRLGDCLLYLYLWLLRSVQVNSKFVLDKKTICLFHSPHPGHHSSNSISLLIWLFKVDCCWFMAHCFLQTKKGKQINSKYLRVLQKQRSNLPEVLFLNT